MSGFGAWAAGPGGTWVLLACLWAVGWILAYLAGCWRGERRALADLEAEVKAERWVSQLRQPPPELPADVPVLYGKRRPRDARGDPDLITKILSQQLEVAHEWEPVHVAQALALTRDDLTDSAYTQDMAARMDRFLEGLFAVPYSADELWSGQ